MKKSVVVDAISYLLVLLFTYTGVTKLLAQNSFLVQIRQHPLLHKYASVLGLAVPIAELAIVICLLVPRLRYKGLAASVILMGAFTGYVGYMISTYTRIELPCSCGGIIRMMSWRQHFIFNACFTMLALAALILDKRNKSYRRDKIQMV